MRGRLTGRRPVRPPVVVVTDSTACLPPEVAERAGVLVVPLDVVVDGVRHVEGVDLAPAELLEAVTRGARVTTSQPPPAAFAEAYARAAALGAREVVSVHLSGDLSGTVRAAQLAATAAPLPVHVVDSRTVGMALGFAVLAAARVAQGAGPDERDAPLVGPTAPVGSLPGDAAAGEPGSGVTPGTRSSGRPGRPGRAGDRSDRWSDRLVQHWNDGPPWSRPQVAPVDGLAVATVARAVGESSAAWFLVDSLDHLRRGGRLSAPAAALGAVLGLRPILALRDGRVTVAEKVRTRRAARERIEALAVAEVRTRGAGRVAVHHLGEPELAAQVAARLTAELRAAAREVVVTEAGAVLGAHVGPGLIALLVTDV